MSLFRKLVGVFQAAGLSIRKRLLGGLPALYVEDVFSTNLYTTTGSDQTITNNIDLSTYGGLVWVKGRSAVKDNVFVDTVRGVSKSLVSNSDNAEDFSSGNYVKAFSTTGFTVSGISGTVYLADTPPTNESESIGNIFLFRFDGQSKPVVIRKSVGNIDYKKGEIRINSINIIDTVKKSFGDNIVQFSAIPKSNDIIGKQDLYIQLDVTSSSVNMISDVISSGIDISGSQYIVSSSYLNGDLVRQ